MSISLSARAVFAQFSPHCLNSLSMTVQKKSRAQKFLVDIRHSVAWWKRSVMDIGTISREQISWLNIVLGSFIHPLLTCGNPPKRVFLGLKEFTWKSCWGIFSWEFSRGEALQNLSEVFFKFLEHFIILLNFYRTLWNLVKILWIKYCGTFWKMNYEFLTPWHFRVSQKAKFPNEDTSP